MSFWKKLFGTAETSPTDPPDKTDSISSRNKVFEPNSKSKLTLLLESVQPIGHPDNPLLRKEYAISSKVPCIDFSAWVSEQLKDKDYNSLWDFVKTLYNENDNLQATVDLSVFIDELVIKTISEKYNLSQDEAKKQVDKSKLNEAKVQAPKLSPLQEAFINFTKKDFRNYITGEEQLLFDLQTFFIIQNGIDDFNREFWISEGKEAEALAKMLCVYFFETRKEGFEELIKKANAFLKEMKTDKLSKDFWKPYLYYGIDKIGSSYSLNIKSDLLEKLKSLSIGERLYFFDYATAYPHRKYWNGDSTYKTRSFGIHEETSLQRIIDLNIFDIVDDIESIPEVTSKGELKEKAELHGLEIKKSWTLEKIFNNLKRSEEGIVFLKDFIIGKRVLKLKSIYMTDLGRLMEYQHEIKVIADLLSMS